MSTWWGSGSPGGWSATPGRVCGVFPKVIGVGSVTSSEDGPLQGGQHPTHPGRVEGKVGGGAVCLCPSWASSLPPTADPLGPTHARTRTRMNVHSLCLRFNEPPGFGSLHLLQPSRPHPEDPCPPPRTSDQPACSPSRTPRTWLLWEGSSWSGGAPHLEGRRWAPHLEERSAVVG